MTDIQDTVRNYTTVVGAACLRMGKTKDLTKVAKYLSIIEQRHKRCKEEVIKLMNEEANGFTFNKNGRTER